MLSIHSQGTENNDPKISGAEKQPPANFQLKVRSHNGICPQNSVFPQKIVVCPIQDMRAHAGEYLSHNKSRVNYLEVINESSLDAIDSFSTMDVMEIDSASKLNFDRDPVLAVIAEITQMVDQLPSGIALTNDSSVNISAMGSVASQSQIDSVDFPEKLIAAIAEQEKHLKLISREIKQLLGHYDSEDHALHQEVQLAVYAKRVGDIHLAVTAIQDDIRNIPEYRAQLLYPELLKKTNKILIALDLSAKKLAGVAVKTVSNTALHLLRTEVSETEAFAQKFGFSWLKKITPQNKAERLHQLKKQLIALYELKEQRDQQIHNDIKNGVLSFSDLISNGSRNAIEDQRKSNEATVYGQTTYGRRKIKQQQMIRTRLNVFAEEGWGIDAGLIKGRVSVHTQTQALAKKYRTQFLRLEKALGQFSIHETINPTTSIAQLLTEAVLNTQVSSGDSVHRSLLADESQVSLGFLDACNALKVLQLKVFYFTEGFVRR